MFFYHRDLTGRAVLTLEHAIGPLGPWALGPLQGPWGPWSSLTNGRGSFGYYESKELSGPLLPIPSVSSSAWDMEADSKVCTYTVFEQVDCERHELGIKYDENR